MLPSQKANKAMMLFLFPYNKANGEEGFLIMRLSDFLRKHHLGKVGKRAFGEGSNPNSSRDGAREVRGEAGRPNRDEKGHITRTMRQMQHAAVF